VFEEGEMVTSTNRVDILSRLDKIEQTIRILKDNHLSHIESRLIRLEEGQSWVKNLLLAVIGIIIASSIGIVFSVRW
tara:strand:+ start:1043 stop:1273 length:231 start_codon:yes stop_codon:yes gene_type:complete